MDNPFFVNPIDYFDLKLSVPCDKATFLLKIWFIVTFKILHSPVFHFALPLSPFLEKEFWFSTLLADTRDHKSFVFSLTNISLCDSIHSPTSKSYLYDENPQMPMSHPPNPSLTSRLLDPIAYMN